MGLRGPKRELDSRRGAAEFGPRAQVVQEQLPTPDDLTAAEARLFRQLVAENRAAGVSIRAIDGHQYVELARLMVQLDELRADVRLALAVSRRISDLRSELGMGPRARYRAGQPDVEPRPVEPSPVARILALAKARRDVTPP
jgi:hypothetical protein